MPVLNAEELLVKARRMEVIQRGEPAFVERIEPLSRSRCRCEWQAVAVNADRVYPESVVKN
jgi:hypothetical protein